MKTLLLVIGLSFQLVAQGDTHPSSDTLETSVIDYFPSDYTSGGWCMTVYSVLICSTTEGDTVAVKMAHMNDLQLPKNVTILEGRNVTRHRFPRAFNESTYAKTPFLTPSKSYTFLGIENDE